MADAEFTVTNPGAPAEAVDPEIERITAEVMANAMAATPVDTGRLRAGYRRMRVAAAHYRIVNDVSYARYVEYGDSRQQAQPALGRALAAARARYGMRP